MPKGAGFRWDNEKKHWWTRNAANARQLAKYADPGTAVALGAGAEYFVNESPLTECAGAHIPSPDGLRYLPYQKAGILYAMKRPATLIADEMGLGKTVQAIGVMNANAGIRRALIVCPAHLKLNWKYELMRWAARPVMAVVINGGAWSYDGETGGDGVITAVIINYDVLHKHRKALRAAPWDLVVFDEAHYLKNPKAKRTKECLGGWTPDGKIAPLRGAWHTLFLTGTPILNRPVELHPVLKSIAPAIFGDWLRYVYRYCDAKRTRFGLDVKGSSNLLELNAKLRATCMIRRMKADVMAELPPKRRQIIEVAPPDARAEAVIQAELDIYRDAADLDRLRLAADAADEATYRAAVADLEVAAAVQFDLLAKARHETALAKLPSVLEHIADTLDAVGKVIVFAHHRDIVDRIADAFAPRSVRVMGGMSPDEKDKAVRRFQEDPGCAVFVGNIQAAGTGITLTAANVVVFAELDWTPGVITQAEDRAHRIGQKSSVLVHHLVLDRSLDAIMARVIIRKQAIIEAAVNWPTAAHEAPTET